LKALVSNRYPLDFKYLAQVCKEKGITIVSDIEIPGESKLGIAMEVEGAPFIVLDSRLHREPHQRLLVLAHELSHVLLGHLHRVNYAVGFSETMYNEGGRLQALHSTDTEVEAEINGWKILVSDDFLHQQVEESIYIPTNALANKYRKEPKWMAARVTLYRLMFGFDRSTELLRNRPVDPFSMSERTTRKLEENTNNDGLLAYFPKIDGHLLSYSL
jgi:Zn-dependent peptidase ImmA (M78 family)